MKILLDTNIVVDIISKRMPFFQESYDSFLKIMKDYEDSVQLMIAKENNVGLIFTRNTKDFVNSPIKVMEPKDYL